MFQYHGIFGVDGFLEFISAIQLNYVALKTTMKFLLHWAMVVIIIFCLQLHVSIYHNEIRKIIYRFQTHPLYPLKNPFPHIKGCQHGLLIFNKIKGKQIKWGFVLLHDPPAYLLACTHQWHCCNTWGSGHTDDQKMSNHPSWATLPVSLRGWYRCPKGTDRPSFLWVSPWLSLVLYFVAKTPSKTCIKEFCKTHNVCTAFMKLKFTFLGPDFTQHLTCQLQDELCSFSKTSRHTLPILKRYFSRWRTSRPMAILGLKKGPVCDIFMDEFTSLLSRPLCRYASPRLSTAWIFSMHLLPHLHGTNNPCCKTGAYCGYCHWGWQCQAQEQGQHRPRPPPSKVFRERLQVTLTKAEIMALARQQESPGQWGQHLHLKKGPTPTKQARCLASVWESHCSQTYSLTPLNYKMMDDGSPCPCVLSLLRQEGRQRSPDGSWWEEFQSC